ncbi:MAG: hypothetical protein R2867_32950 [Caldilineaceae bacterium]
MMTGRGHEYEQSKRDEFWTVPHRNILDAQFVDSYIKLITAAVTWEIYRHFNEADQMILASFRMAMTGEIKKIWEAEDQSSPSVETAEAPLVKDISNDNIKKRLSRLLELYQEDLIAEENTRNAGLKYLMNCRRIN